MKKSKFSFLSCMAVLGMWLMFSPSSVFAQGSWVQKANLTGDARSFASGFGIGSKGYVCLGEGFDGNFAVELTDLWEYDQNTNTWAKKADFPGMATHSAVGFSIGTKGYVLGGSYSGGHSVELWEYNPGTNTWLQKASIPAAWDEFRRAQSFVIGTKVYVGGAMNDGHEWHVWDQSTNVWSRIADFPDINRAWGVAFAVGGKGYVGTGDSGNGALNDFYEYNPATNMWTQKASIPVGRTDAVAFSIGSYGYVAMGVSSANTTMQDIYRYDPATNTWVAQANAPLGLTYTVAFTLNGKGYVGTGLQTKVLYEFTPGSVNSITTGSITPTICAGATVTVPFTIAGTFTSGNVFTAQLSNSTGSFATPVSIGTLTGTTAGSISATIPASTTAGSAYRIRVISSNPAVNGSDNGSNITIQSVSLSASVTGPVSGCSATSICQGSSITLTASQTLSSYLWSNGATTQSIQVFNTGSYSVTGTNSNGCQGTSSPVSVTVTSPPAASIGVSGSTLTANPVGTAYQWYLDGNPINGATGRVHTATAAGNYSVSIMHSSGCVSKSSVQAYPTVEVEEREEIIGVNVYPNPSRGIFTIEFAMPDDGKVTIEIYDLGGKLVYRENISEKGYITKSIDLSYLADSVYSLSINSTGGKTIKKLIIE